MANPRPTAKFTHFLKAEEEIQSKFIHVLVAAGGIEPPTYGL
jgi:hypothetical protein